MIWYGSFLLFCTLVFPKLCHPRYVWTQSASSYHHPCIFCRKLFRAGRFYNFFSFGHTRSYIQVLKLKTCSELAGFTMFFFQLYQKLYSSFSNGKLTCVPVCLNCTEYSEAYLSKSICRVKSTLKKKILKSNYKSALKSSIFSIS